MSYDTLEQTVKSAFEYASDFAGFAFQGGEPTLAGIGFFRKLIEFQKKYNTDNIKVSNSIQTNGYALNEEWAEFFARNNFLVGVSLDGTREVHNALRTDTEEKGTYDAVVRNIKLLERYGAEFNVLCVVTNIAARHPQQIYSRLKEYGYIQFIPCLDPFDSDKDFYSLTAKRYSDFLVNTFNLYYGDFINGSYVSIRNFDNYINILLGYPPENCAMNGYCTCNCVIEGDGSVFPCDFYSLDEWKLGNINTCSFEEMISSAKANEFVDSSKYISEKCRKCGYYSLCRGGCRREREPFVEGHPGENRLCDSFISFFDQCLPKMRDMAQKLSRQTR